MYMLILFLLFSIKTSFLVNGDLTVPEENAIDVLKVNQTVQKPKVIVPRRITHIMFLLPRKNDSYCSSVDEFPTFFTDKQRKNGAIIIPFLVGIYCFTLLAIICDKYFLPCVEKICEFLHLSQDVAAATFMAMATSAPELFINIIGTFVTESDVGIGTVVGSSMFNTLGVAALGGIAARTPIQVDWWPVTRDCFLYLLSITLLVVMTWDGIVYWYEGMVLFMVYFMYFTVMFNNTRISKLCKSAIKKFTTKMNTSTDDLIKSKTSCDNTSSTCISISTPPIYLIENDIKEFTKSVQMHETQQINTESTEHPLKLYSELKHIEKEKFEQIVNQEAFNAYVELKQIQIEKVAESTNDDKRLSIKQRFFKTSVYLYTLPIKALLFCLIPNPNIRPKLFPVTFILCIVVIGANSYIISWMITIIGHTFRISDTVLGLTFLAAGACLPEAISIILMSRKGEGSMGVSNALGANTMNILLSLGLPWFIKTMIVNNGKGRASFIEIASGAIEYTILSLILVVCALFITLYFNNFKLQKKTGIILTVIYLIFLTCTLVAELLILDTKPC